MPLEKKEASGQQSSFHSQLTEMTNELYRRSFAEVYIAGGASAASEELPQKSGVPEPVRPETDPIRKRFIEMRYLASSTRQKYSNYERIRASSFYRQGKFMESFEDNYAETAAFSMYFPEYQMMSYEQLRTYFTWRTAVRRGVVQDTSYSYVFLYLYELFNGIGVKDCTEGLDRLLFLWEEYRGFETKLDKYMAQWVKDFYITNDFSVTFSELVSKSALLAEFYPRAGQLDYFELYAPLAEYKWAKSVFCSEETDRNIRGCFQAVAEALSALVSQSGTDFDDLIFFSNKGNGWFPFQKAIYYQRSDPNVKKKTVKISPTEVYWYDSGRWISSLNRVCRENGRRLLGYLIRRIERFYRKAESFKYQLAASPEKLDQEEIRRVGVDPEAFFACVDRTIAEYYRESRRRVVTVDPAALERIRTDALATQEKLLAGSEETAEDSTAFLWAEAPPAALEAPAPPIQSIPPEKTASGPWEELARSLDATERTALQMLLKGASLSEFSALAKAAHKMPEVLADGINEKAIETVGDTLFELSDSVAVFLEYKGELERVIYESDESSEADYQHHHQRAEGRRCAEGGA